MEDVTKAGVCETALLCCDFFSSGCVSDFIAWDLKSLIVIIRFGALRGCASFYAILVDVPSACVFFTPLVGVGGNEVPTRGIDGANKKKQSTGLFFFICPIL